MSRDTDFLHGLDDRSPFAVAMAVTDTLLEQSPSLETPEAVWDAILAAGGQDSALYLQTIAESGHSVFYHQLQKLYALAHEQIPEAGRDGFAAAAGRRFMGGFLEASLSQLLQIALGQPGDFQRNVIGVLQQQLHRYGGAKYVIGSELSPGSVRLTLAYADPAQLAAYLEPFGLEPAGCFPNSFGFIGGAVAEFVERIIDGVAEGAGAEWTLAADGLSGTYVLPIAQDSRFAHARLMPTLVGAITDLQRRSKELTASDQLESSLIADSQLMRDTWSRIRRAGRTDELVLLRGESGTGKSYIARKVHALSGRRDKPFVEVCLTSDIGSDNMIQSDLFGHEKGAFTGAVEAKQGLFQLADGGTIFLDEVGDATPELQAKLLRVVESGKFKRLGSGGDTAVDVRVIAATNRDLEAMVAHGTFRQDLYYRLSVIPVRLPSLRDRRDDVPALAEYLLARSQRGREGETAALAPGLPERLALYDWPGNIRELDHALRYAAAMGHNAMITEADLPDVVQNALNGGAAGAPALAPPPAAAGVAAGTDIDTDTDTDPEDDETVINVDALRRRIRGRRPAADVAPHEDPSHIEHAKFTWLRTLIDECGGDLALIAQFWDRSSEKTLRNLIRAYGLADALAAARSQAKGS
jgi:DNA-binding NtrC family response regulator